MCRTSSLTAAQIDKNTFKNVPVGNLPEDMNMINGTWRFTVKVDKKTGLVTRFKARFCARGDMQVAGVDYFDTSSPVVSYTTLRLLFALACLFSWIILSIDVVTAFLNADIEEEVYMKPGKGFPKVDGMIWRLLKGVYGTCQASRAWWKLFNSWITRDPEIRPSTIDPCLYIAVCLTDSSLFCLLLLYVDDVIAMGNSPSYTREVLNRIQSKFDTTGGEEFTQGLGLECEYDRDAGTLKLHQTRWRGQSGS